MEKLLKIRNNLKAKKPTFVRHDSHKKKRVSPAWRRPKGRQNKVRLHKKGYVRHVSTGYGSPAAVKGLSRDGYRQCRVTSKKDVEALNPSTDGIIVSSGVGDRKREEIISYATEKKFRILNLDPENFKKNLKQKLDTKSSKRKDVLKRRAKKEKAAKEKKDDKKASKQDGAGSSETTSGTNAPQQMDDSPSAPEADEKKSEQKGDDNSQSKGDQQ